MTANKTLNTAVGIVNTSVGKNRIINGDFRVWQRGTSLSMATATSNDYLIADRWYSEASNGGGNSTGGTVVWQQSTDSTSAYGGQYYMNMTCTSMANTASVSTSQITIFQRIESTNIYDLANKQVTLSFYASASASSGGNFVGNVYLGYGATADNYTSPTYIGPITFSPTSTPTKFTITTTLTSGFQNGCVIYIRLLNTGSTATSVVFNVGSVQLEAGSVATPFERRQYGTELALCQRYCYLLPAGGGFLSTGCWAGAGGGFFQGNFPQVMRVVPSLTLSNTIGNYYTYNVGPGTYTALSSMSVNGVTSNNYYLLSFASSGTPGTTGLTTYLSVQSTGSYMYFSAEI